MKHALLSAISALFLIVSVANAQQVTSGKQGAAPTPAVPERCNSANIHNDLYQNDLTYRVNFDNAQAQVQNMLQNQLNYLRSGSGVLTVPVVVHVIHLGETVGTGTNISDAQIQSAITALNNDYRKVTGTAGDGSGVDVEIEFCLAVRDPSGNATTGVNRIDGSATCGGGDCYNVTGITDNNETDIKALSVWPNTDYYNIWVVSEIDDNGGGAGTQGYAYFPGAGPTIDGTVILYNAFGFDPGGVIGYNLKSYTDMNRTLTHELGHALDLYHTFQGDVNGTTCPPNGNCATDGDEVCDTDPHIRSSSNCPTGTNACSGNPDQDIVRNYMDYSNETCQDEFSQNQKDRMRAALCGARASLLTSLGCTPVNALDVGISAINLPNGSTCGTSFNPEVVLINYGATTVTTCDILYNVDGGAPTTYNWTGTLATGAFETVTLNNATTTAGAHTFTAYTTLPNGGTDDDMSSDTLSSAFTATAGNAVNFMLQTDNFGSETTWSFQDQFGTVIDQGGPYTNLVGGITIDTTYCVADGLYDFIIDDSFGDGICCGNGNGSYTLTDNFGNTLASGGTFTFQDSTRFPLPFSAPAGNDAGISGINTPTGTICSLSIAGEIELENLGPNTLTSVDINYGFDGTTPNVFNWTGSLTTGNTATVTLPAITTTAGAHTYNVNTSNPNGGTDDDPSNDASFTNFTAASGNSMTFNVTTDQYGTETTWIVKTAAGVTVASGGPYGPDLAGPGTTAHIESLCLPDGCYDLVVSDLFGDGMCCAFGNGGYDLQTAGGASVASGGTFTFTDSTRFCLPLASDDAGIAEIIAPTGTACDTVIAGIVVIQNFGSSTLTSATINYGIDGTTPNVFSWTGSLAGGGLDTVSLPTITAAAGAHTYDANTTLPNGNADGDASNDASSGAFTALVGNLIDLTVTTDQYGTETSWVINNTSGTTLFSGGTYGPDLAGPGTTVHNEQVCLADGCYDLIVSDVFGDGMCCAFGNGGYLLEDASNNALASGGTFTFQDSTRFCVPVVAEDIGISEVLAPTGTECDTTISGVVVLRNFGSSTVTTANINYGINGTTPNVFNWTGTLAGGASDTITLPDLQVNAGTHTYDANSTMPNGNADGNASNDAASASFTAINGNVIDLTITTDQYGTETTWVINDGGGTTLFSGGPYGPNLGGVGTTINTDQVCLADGCYDFIIFDAFGDGMCCAFGNGSYLVDDASNNVLASGATFTNQDSTNFCVPFVATPPTASFTADFTSIPVGGSVNFTDLSTANPAITSWAWNFGGGVAVNTSADQHPATGPWNTPGTYDIELIVTNAAGADTALQVGYITVYDPAGVCDTLTNIDDPANLTLFPLVDGFFAGHSNDSLTEFADMVVTPAPTNVMSLLVPIASAHSGTGTSTVDFHIYDNAGGQPGAILGTETVQISTLQTGQFNLVQFTTPVAVTDTFFTGFEISYAAPQDSVHVFINSNQGPGGTATAWTFGDLGGGPQWFDFEAISGGFTTSLGIYALVSTGGTVPSFTQDATNICPGNMVNFDGSGSTNATDYFWNFSNGTPATATGVTASSTFNMIGTWTVKLFTEGGCRLDSTDATVVVGSGGLTPTISGSTDNICFGDCNGTATATAGGGTSPYTYVWGGSGQTTATATGLCAGSYTVTVSDAGGCSATASISISEPTQLVVVASPTNPTMAGGSDGSAAATPTGGISPYTFVWDATTGNQTTPTAVGLSAGTYSVTVTDANGCTSTQVTTLNDPGCTLALTTTSNNLNCAGSCTGSATATPSGAVMPVTYLWSNGATTATISSLCPGTYTVTVTDAAACTQTDMVTITGPAPIAVTETSTNPTMPGGSNGTATLSATGGVSPYTYLWSNGQATATATGLVAGSYTWTVTDANACDTTSVVVIVDPGCSLVASAAHTDEICAGACDGTATATATSGTPPYSYMWSNASTTATITGLCPGSYTVTITDATACTQTAGVTILSGGLPTVSVTGVDPGTPGGSDGSASAVASGGVAPYTYLWSNGATTASITNLVAGTYCVTLTDANGCMDIACTTITDPACSITASTSATDETCAGNCDGTATATGSGGTAPYTYLWSDGQTTATATGLCPATYNVTVTDALACSATSSATVTGPTAIAANLSGTDPSSAGGTDGSVSSTPTGGTPPYSYLWDAAAGNQTTATAVGLSAGTYCVTITDANGCTTTSCASINDPGCTLTLAMSASDVICHGDNNGTATATPIGGTSPYTILWSDGQTAATAIMLTANAYAVTVTDAGGCTQVGNITVNEPPMLTLSLVGNDPSGAGATDGSVSSTVGGGVSPYTYLWAPGSQTTANLSSVGAGTYTLSVTDANGCTVNTSETLTDPCNLTVSLVSNNPTCNGVNNGIIDATPAGGTTPYTYAWSSGGNGPIEIGLIDGTYTVTVTDAGGCTTTATSTLVDPAVVTIATQTFSPTLAGGSDGSATAVSTGGTGNFWYTWDGGTIADTLTGLSAGEICVTASDFNGCLAITCDTVVDPPCAIVTTVTSSDATCNGTNNGIATAAASNGISPFSYAWSTGGNAALEIGMPAGTHQVIVTDAAGCMDTTDVVINQPPALAATFVTTDASCGLNNGIATATVSGGVSSPYTVTWPSGTVGFTDSMLAGGTFTISITDANLCTGTASVTINATTGPTVTASATDENCGLLNGTLSAIGTGGAPPYSYAWSSGSTGANVNGVAPGQYMVTLTDANGCTDVDTTNVGFIPGPIAAPVVTSTSCGLNNGEGTIAATGGTTPYSYSWSTGGTGMTEINLAAGTYFYTLTDADGCTVTDSIVITGSSAISATASATNTSGCGINDGTATATPTGGTMPYTYQWTFGQTTQTATGLAAGSHSVTVTDLLGCTATATTNILATGGPAVTASSSNVTCNGGADGLASVTASGGTPPYTTTWSDGQTTTTAVGLAAGTYTVTITDNSGCIATTNVTITEPAAWSVTINTVDENPGQSNGSASVFPMGGQSPYTYAWSSGGTGASEIGLAAGTYTVTITDFNGCTQVASVTINTLVLCPTYSIAGTQSSCNVNDGSAMVTSTGCTAPFSYVWSNGANGATITGLGAGMYTVTVTDALGCDSVMNVTITNPAGPSVSLTVADATCGQDNGSVVSSASGGMPPYSYAWSTGALTANTSNLAPGTYHLTVTDANGCATVDSATVVLATSGPLASISTVNTACGDSIGSATLTITGGVAPYTYAWSTGGTAATEMGLWAAAHSVTITDGAGCQAVETVIINDAGSGSTNLIGNGITCAGFNDASITVVLAGATAQSYLWSNGDTTANADSLSPGPYSVTVTDVANCSYIEVITITDPDPVTVNVSATDGLCGQNNGTATALAGGGTAPYIYFWSSNEFTPNPMNLAAGTYFVTVTDAVGCEVIDSVVVNAADPLVMTATVIDETCLDGNGIVSLATTGGTLPIFFNWSNGATGSGQTGLSSGLYTITATDNDGCTDVVNATVVNIGNVTANISGDQTICGGETVVIAANGGTQYQWSNGAASASIVVSPGTTTTYTVTVSDGLGCDDVVSSTVTVNTIPAVSVSATADTICPGDSVTITATGAQTYEWNTGDTTGTITVAPAATTSYIVVGFNGDCGASPVSTTVFIHPFSPVAIAASSDTIAYLGSGGVVNFSSSGSIGSLFEWDFDGNGAIDDNQPNGSFTYTLPGTYNAILYASLNGCMVSDTIVITTSNGVGLDAYSALARNIEVYPNPTFGQVFLELTLPQPERVRIEVFNAVGEVVRVVAEGELSQQQRYTIDLSGEARGLYSIRIIAAGQIVNRQVIKMD